MIHEELTAEIIGGAIEVHREIGPGEDEVVYEEALQRVLREKQIPFQAQRPLPVIYRDCKLDCGYRLDLLVADKVVVEVKAVEHVLPIHLAQLLTYLSLGRWHVGLLLNFNVAVMKDGIHRRVLERDSTVAANTVHGQPQSAQQQVVAASDVADLLLGAAIEVHRALGPGLLRSAYEACLCHELALRGIPFQRNVAVALRFRGEPLGRVSEVDLLVGGTLPIKLLSVDQVTEVHKGHFSSQLRQGGWSSGLLLNFNAPLLRQGICRCFSSPSSPRPPSSAVQA